MTRQLDGPAINPLGRILFGLLGVAALVGAFFFGLVILVVALGLGALGWLALSLRVWWLKRQMGRAGDDIIEAEYRVVSSERDGEEPPN